MIVWIVAGLWLLADLALVAFGWAWHNHRAEFTEPDAPNADVRSLDAQRALHPRRSELGARGEEEGA